MSNVIRWLFRIGVICGALAALCALLIAADDLGMALGTPVLTTAERAATWFGLAFMWIGVAMLINAIREVGKMWRAMSPFGKFISVVGLMITTFLGGYIFYYFHSRSAFSPSASSRTSAT
jgi:hypothetical protein